MQTRSSKVPRGRGRGPWRGTSAVRIRAVQVEPGYAAGEEASVAASASFDRHQGLDPVDLAGCRVGMRTGVVLRLRHRPAQARRQDRGGVVAPGRPARGRPAPVVRAAPPGRRGPAEPGQNRRRFGDAAPGARPRRRSPRPSRPSRTSRRTRTWAGERVAVAVAGSGRARACRGSGRSPRPRPGRAGREVDAVVLVDVARTAGPPRSGCRGESLPAVVGQLDGQAGSSPGRPAAGTIRTTAAR